ncbi:hypothetical protein [uncultured Neptuniibacter sp.]|uniref:hypothetical protein n=1 Tax=uncultured Neptuniibacter sp. TaxID=502143 RepID=UPI002613F539|nr:hypothetical protein [uncultured Neptuniibacter sp.]
MKKTDKNSLPHKLKNSKKVKRKSKKPKAKNSQRKCTQAQSISELDDAVKQLRESLKNIRTIIYIIYKLKLWRDRHESFEDFIKEELSDLCSRTTAYRHVKAAEIDEVLRLPIGTVPITVTDVISTDKLTPKRIRRIWKKAQTTSRKEVPTIPSIQQCLKEHSQAKAAYKWITKPSNWDYLLNELSSRHKDKMKSHLTKLSSALDE